jgi:hypothetical protein
VGIASIERSGGGGGRDPENPENTKVKRVY